MELKEEKSNSAVLSKTKKKKSGKYIKDFGSQEECNLRERD